jgi:diacylglycerol kinase family enzyme
MNVDRLVVVVNPAAGGGRAGGVWERLLRDAPELAAARLVAAADVESCVRELDEQLAGDAEAVVAVGGDGTAHLVVNRLLETGTAGRVAFGLVPAGTGSDLARCLGLPRHPLDGWRRLRDAAPRRIDALEVTTDAGARRFVVNVASAGVSGAVDERVNAIAHRGRFTFHRETLAALWHYEPVPCRVHVDGEELYDGGFFVVAIANGRSFGRGMRIAPRASLDDGLADVVLIEPLPFWRVPLRMPRLLAGRHLGLDGVLFTRARTVRLEPRGAMPPFDVDGETLASGPATIRVLPGALRVLSSG